MKNVMNTKKNELNTVDLTADFSPEKFKKIFNENIKLNEENLKLNEENLKLGEDIKKLAKRIEQLEEYINLKKHQKYGRSSEKTDPNQISFYDCLEAETIVEEAIESGEPIEEPTVEKVLAKRRKGHVGASKPCFDDLEVRVVEHKLSGDDLTCSSCGDKLKEMKVDIREEIEYIPSKLVKVIHKNYSYSCPSCQKGEGDNTGVTRCAKLPVLPGSFASASLIALILSVKYWMKTPLYRAESVFENKGFSLSRQTMANWVIKSSQMYLEPVYDALHRHLLSMKIIHADETPFKVLEETQNSSRSNCYMWIYCSGQSQDKRIILYDYKANRKGENPKNFLEGFTGYLQTDMYSGYRNLTGVTQVGCLAHARRKFTDAVNSMGKKKASGTIAQQGLNLYNRIFSLDKKASHLKGEDRRKWRLDHITNEVEALKSWLESNIGRVVSGSLTGKAIEYSLNHFNTLMRFMKDGDLELTNNIAERAVKEFVIGRKNFLFSQSNEGAGASAVVFSIVETAKLYGLNPFEYLKYLLEELSQKRHTDELIESVLPWSNTLPDYVRSKPDS